MVTKKKAAAAKKKKKRMPILQHVPEQISVTAYQDPPSTAVFADESARASLADAGKPVGKPVGDSIDIEATNQTSVPERLQVPAQEFKFGYGTNIFPEDRPIVGGDVERLKIEAGYDLNTLEATLGISRREFYYELSDEIGDKPLPDISMAILIRLYEAFPRELLPFQPISWADYLTIIGVHPIEFAQLVGRTFNTGKSWQEGVSPIRSTQLIIQAFWRAGVQDTSHPVYQKFLQIAVAEMKLRSKIWLNAQHEDDVAVRAEVIDKLGEVDGLVALYKFNSEGSIVGALEKELANTKGEPVTKEEAMKKVVAKVLDQHGIKKPTFNPNRKRRPTRAILNAEDSLMQPVDD